MNEGGSEVDEFTSNLKEVEVNHQEEGLVELDLTIAPGGKLEGGPCCKW